MSDASFFDFLISSAVIDPLYTIPHLLSKNVDISKMEGDKEIRTVVISDLEKAVDVKMVTQYLTATKVINAVRRFNKTNDRFFLEFQLQKEAEGFIQERAFKDQIIERKLNLYLQTFEDRNRTFQAYILNGVDEQILRKVYEICSEYSLCRFLLTMQGEKKVKTVVQFDVKRKGKATYYELVHQLGKIGITLQEMQEENGEFVCSIELLNFDKVQNVQLNESERKRLEQSLIIFMGKISERRIKNMEVKTFLHQQKQPMIKAYFKYPNSSETLEVFQQLRLNLLQAPPSMRCKLFYYSKQANSFRTLFTIGLQMPPDISQKQWQHMMLEDFRKFNPGVTQIITKECAGKIWTGKIYMKDQENGKELVCDFPLRRNLIFKHYKDKSKIVINLFQDKKTINQTRRIQNNTERMLDHIKTTHEREKKMAPIQIQQNCIPRMQEYPRRNQQRKGQERVQKRQERVHKQEKKEEKKEKMKYRPKEQDFPSL